MSFRLFHIACFFLLAMKLSWGQTTVEVITKTVKDQFVIRPNQTLKVEGNAAAISIQSWDRQEVQVTMKLISKGLERSVAEEELRYQQYIIDKSNNAHIIRNYLLLPKGLDKLSTIQETVIELRVPSSLLMSVSNKFGSTKVGNVAGIIEIHNEYGELSLESVNGELRVNSNFGDLKMTDFVGVLKGTLQHSKVDIQGFSGSADIRSKLGDMNWSGVNESAELKLSAEQSNVSFDKTATKAYFWKLRTKYGFIQFPGMDPGKNLTIGEDELPLIEVSTDFGEITIKE